MNSTTENDAGSPSIFNSSPVTGHHAEFVDPLTRGPPADTVTAEHTSPRQIAAGSAEPTFENAAREGTTCEPRRGILQFYLVHNV